MGEISILYTWHECVYKESTDTDSMEQNKKEEDFGKRN